MNGCNGECDRLRDKIRTMVGVSRTEADEVCAEIEALENEVEQLGVQLAGCGVAAMCNTHKSREGQKCVQGDYGWSQSYQDVVNAVEREIALREKYEELILAVGNKYPNESRHETALRYIRNAERCDNTPAQTAK